MMMYSNYPVAVFGGCNSLLLALAASFDRVFVSVLVVMESRLRRRRRRRLACGH